MKLDSKAVRERATKPINFSMGNFLQMHNQFLAAQVLRLNKHHTQHGLGRMLFDAINRHVVHSPPETDLLLPDVDWRDVLNEKEKSNPEWGEAILTIAKQAAKEMGDCQGFIEDIQGDHVHQMLSAIAQSPAIVDTKKAQAEQAFMVSLTGSAAHQIFLLLGYPPVSAMSTLPRGIDSRKSIIKLVKCFMGAQKSFLQARGLESFVGKLAYPEIAFGNRVVDFNDVHERTAFFGYGSDGESQQSLQKARNEEADLLERQMRRREFFRRSGEN